SNIDQLRHLLAFKEKTTRAGEIINVEKLAPRCSRSPDHDLRRATRLVFVNFAQQRWQDVRVVQIEVVARSVKIRRHRGSEVASIFASVGLAELDPGNICDLILVVRGLERTREQRRLGNRLRRELRINARAAEKKQPARAG